MNAPVIGAEARTYSVADSWQVAVTWRYQKSHRHFVGSDEQEERAEEGSEVINHLNLLDTTVSYNVSERTSISLSAPYVMAERSSPIRDEERAVVDRSTTQARGLGDLIVIGRRWLRDPTTSPNANVSLGLGLKLPTGDDNVQDTRMVYDDGDIVPVVQTVDQSIQPGDGGFGALLEATWFTRLAEGRASLFAGLSYLVNLEGTNGVYTYRSRASEAFMSIADQYLATVGGAVAIPAAEGLALSLGGRLEGVPKEDLVGSSEGFRRPGYAVSAEPGVSWSRGANTWSLSVPVAVYRNRVRSVADEQDNRHGDAAFADWLLLAGFVHRF